MANEDRTPVKCSPCGADLTDFHYKSGSTKPCPNCGGTSRLFQKVLMGSITVYSSLATKQMRPGVKKPVAEGSTRHGPGGDGEVVRVKRTIDRLNDRYTERVEDEHGRILVDKDEKLSEHTSSSHLRHARKRETQS